GKALENTYFDDRYQEEKLMSYLDNLNLLYVAFTRPKYRLYVFGVQKSGKISEVKTSSQLIQVLLNQGALAGQKTAEPFGLTRGEQIDRASIRTLEGEESQAEEEALELVANARPNKIWNEAVRIKYSSNRFLPDDILSRNARIQMGELLHHALSFVDTQSDIPKACQKMQEQAYITRKQIPTLERQLEGIVNHLQAADWFSGNWQVRNEAEIITASGMVLRPDRVMFQGPLAVVVDYKTGQPSPKYAKQLDRYRYALKEMGYGPVKAYIYYLNLGMVEGV
ncbi:MAG: PD-(D/E)XK nuclease family protein, partial [Bacteroidota bacterium]